MIRKLKQSLTSLLNTGVYHDTNTSEIKRIRLLNSFWFTWACLIIPFAIEDFFSSQNLIGSMTIHVVSAIVLFFVFWLQYQKQYLLARVLFTSFTVVIIGIITNFVEVGENVEIIYYLVPIISLLLIHNKWINRTYLMICFLFFYIPNAVFDYHHGTFQNPVTIASVFLGIYIAFNYSQTLNRKNEQKLEVAYQKLEETKKSELAHLQLKSLKAQMNPHFMFNAMNSIQHLVLKGDKQEAYNYLTKFSSMIRENLNMSEKSFVCFEEEYSLLTKYLELEKLRFSKSFEYKLVGAHHIEDIKIPSMVIQPFIENAIKHGLLHKTTGIKKLEIVFAQTDVFECIITDNGIGIQKSLEINKQNDIVHHSFSTNAIKERLQLLKDYYKTDIGFSYIPCKYGTKVKIKIPYTR